MSMKKLIPVVLLILAAGCSAGQPAWVTNSTHPGYAPEHFLVGVGLSSRSRDPQADMQKADANARLEVAKQLRVNIQSSLSSRKKQKTRASLPQTYTSETAIDSTENVDILLQGITIADRYYSKKDQLHYAIAVLNKPETAHRLASEMTRHSSRVSELSRQCKELLEKGDTIGALHKGIKALDHYRRYMDNRQMIAVLDPMAPAGKETPPRDPYDEVAKIKGSLSLMGLGGDMQTAKKGSGLAETLRVKAMVHGTTPLANLPVKATFSPGSTSKAQAVATGPGGKASVRILGVAATQTPLNPVEVTVDWNRIIKDALGEKPGPSWEGVLSGPSVRFTYALRTPETSCVQLKIHTRQNDAGVDATSILSPVSADLFRKKGFQVQSRGQHSDRHTNGSGSKATILVVEKVDVQYSGRRGRGVVYRARMSVTAYDTASRSIIASAHGTALGGASSRKAAAERAIKDVANDLLPKLAARMAEGL
ncbi:lipoprotein lpp20-like [Desulfoluna butyratoxydans]|uniref:Lipoprotein lpp20-like n=2 Tax=Desulfoluna butyratoxydans TaxID=231438 RepID=A0A4U8YYB1_9BACT|nr:lipoprotein lpp20-like [Desulfoluna butyratoxydans]